MENISLQEALDMAGNYATMNNAHPFSSLWAFHFHNDSETWCVAARLATAPLAPSNIPLENLSLDPEKEYLVFDFWKQQFIGIVKDTLNVGALDLGSCQIIGLRQVIGRPQFLGSSRHVSMDCVSVRSSSWSQNSLELILSGIPGTTETYWIYKPNAYCLHSSTCEGGHLSLEQCGEIVRCNIRFDGKESRVVLSFNMT